MNYGNFDDIKIYRDSKHDLMVKTGYYFRHPQFIEPQRIIDLLLWAFGEDEVKTELMTIISSKRKGDVSTVLAVVDQPGFSAIYKQKLAEMFELAKDMIGVTRANYQKLDFKTWRLREKPHGDMGAQWGVF